MHNAYIHQTQIDWKYVAQSLEVVWTNQFRSFLIILKIIVEFGYNLSYSYILSYSALKLIYILLSVLWLIYVLILFVYKYIWQN
jgi:hypothetical protein